MTLNDLEWCNSPYLAFCFFSPNSIAMQAGFVTVVEDRNIMSVKFCFPVPVFHFWPKLTHPSARSLCDSWASCLNPRSCIICGMWQEDTETSLLEVTYGAGSSVHEAISAASAFNRQSTESSTTHGRAAPGTCKLDLRGSSFQPHQLSMQCDVDPSETLTHLTSVTSSEGRYSTTSVGNLEQYGVPSVQRSVPPTTDEDIWRSADPTLTFTTLQSTMVTAASAAAPATTCSSCEVMTHGVPLMIAEDDSSFWETGPDSEVFLLKFYIIMKL